MVYTSIQDLKKFIEFAKKELKLPSLPQIKFVGDSENKLDAFGHSLGRLIVVRVTGRHPIDICRTIGHELIHYKQNVLRIRMNQNKKEDQANELAGRLMQKFDTAYPNVFRDRTVRANMMLEEFIIEDEGLGGVAANHTGFGVANFDPLLAVEKTKRGRKQGEYNLKNLFYKKRPKSLKQIIGQEMKNEK